MLLTILASVLLAVGATAVPHDKRDTLSDITIYAYGTAINGLPILADSSGIAYVTSATVQPANLSSVTWTITTDGSAEWTVAINSTNSTATTAGTFYIIPTTDAFKPVGFVIANATAPSGAVTNAFRTYGSDVMYTDGTTYQSQFWALARNGTDEWEIMWNESGASEDGAVPVTLKTTALTV